jgi:hypothetical protein
MHRAKGAIHLTWAKVTQLRIHPQLFLQCSSPPRVSKMMCVLRTGDHLSQQPLPSFGDLGTPQVDV